MNVSDVVNRGDKVKVYYLFPSSHIHTYVWSYTYSLYAY